MTSDDFTKRRLVEDFLRTHPGQTVIFVQYKSVRLPIPQTMHVPNANHVQTTNDLPKSIRSWLGDHVTTEGYNGSLSMTKRKEVEERFMDGKIRVVSRFSPFFMVSPMR